MIKANRITLTKSQAKQLGRRLRHARLQQGFTQLEVADAALGFEKSHAFISRVERAVLRDIPVQRVEKVAHLLGENPNVLLGTAYSELTALPSPVKQTLIELAQRYRNGTLSAQKLKALSTLL